MRDYIVAVPYIVVVITLEFLNDNGVIWYRILIIRYGIWIFLDASMNFLKT